MSEETIKTIFEFDVRGDKDVTDIDKKLDKFRNNLKRLGLSFDDLGKATVRYSTDAKKLDIFGKAISATFKTLTREGQRAVITLNKQGNATIKLTADLDIAAKGIARLKVELASLNKIKSVSVTGARAPLSADRLVAYQRAIDNVNSRLRQLRALELSEPETRSKQKGKIAALTEQKIKIQQIITALKQQVKEEQRVAEVIRRNRADVTALRGVSQAGPVTTLTGPLADQLEIQKRHLRDLSTETNRLNALTLQSDRGTTAKKARILAIKQEIMATKEAIIVTKRHIAVEEQRRKQAQQTANFIARSAADRSALASVSTSILAPRGGTSQEELKIQLTYIRDLNREQARLNALQLQTATATERRRARLSAIREELYLSKDMVVAVKQQIRVEEQLRKQREKNIQLITKRRAAESSIRQIEARPGLTVAGNQQQRIIQVRQFIEQEIQAKRQLLSIEKKLIAVQDQGNARFKQRVANAIAHNRVLQQQAGINISNARSAIASANAQATALETLKKHGHSLFLNLSNAARVLQFILLHRAFFAIAQGMMDGAKAAAELSIRIGEIRTISDRTLVSHEEWKSTIRTLSDEFAQNLGTTAEGVYQAISNQVIVTNNQVTFFIENMKLATVTISTFDDAVQATTSIINAFGVSINQTNYIAGILFKTVELGRVRLNEMANTIGRVSILSSNLGVTFEEQQAALVALTIQGVKFNTAETYLINVLQKLIRPSDRMKEIFEEWGVTSGEAAIRTFGFINVIQKLHQIAEQSGDMMVELGEQFQRVRATTGAVGLSTEKFNEALGKMVDGGKAVSEAYETVRETMGKRLQIELQKVKNIFTLDFGESLTKMLITLSDRFGGLNLAMLSAIRIGGQLLAGWLAWKVAIQASNALLALSSSVWAAYNAHRAKSIALTTSHSVTMASATGAQVAYTATTVGAAAATNTFNAALATTQLLLGNILAPLIGIASFFATKYYLSAKTAAIATEELGRELGAKAQAATVASESYKILSTEITAYNKKAEETIKTARQMVAAYAAGINERLKFFGPLFEDIERVTKRVINRTSDSAKETIKGLETAIDDIKKSIEKAFEEINESTFTRVDSVFAATIRNLGLRGNEGLNVVENRIKMFQKQMAMGLIRPKNIEELRAFQQEFMKLQLILQKADVFKKESLEKQIEFANEAAQKYMAAGLNRLSIAGTPEERDLANKQIELAEKFFKERDKLIDSYIEKFETDLITAQQTILTMQQDELNIIEAKNMAELQYIETVKAKEKAFAEEKAAREVAFEDLQEQLDKIKDFNYADVGNKKAGTRDKFLELARKADELATAAGVGMDERLALHQHLMESYNTQVERDQLKHQAEMAKQTQAYFTDLSNIYNIFNQKLQDHEAKARNALASVSSSLGEISGSALATVEGPEKDWKEELRWYEHQNKVIKESIAAGTRARGIGEKEIAQNEEKIRQYQEQLMIIGQVRNISRHLSQGLINTPEELALAREQILQLTNLLRQKGIVGVEQFTGAIDALNKAEEKFMEADQKYREIYEFFSTQIKPQYQALYDLQWGIVDVTRLELAQQYELIKRLQESVAWIKHRAELLQENLPVPAASALGGTRGNDRRIVAMDPREFIINAEASRTYRPILEAINSKRIPSFSQGGSVTNVGDIKVSVNGGDSSAQTIREIAQGINREIRLGRIKINV